VLKIECGPCGIIELTMHLHVYVVVCGGFRVDGKGHTYKVTNWHEGVISFS
jgi:hypothetical protein